MGRFILACWSFETHSDVFLAVGQALRRRGHDVAFYTAPREQERVEATGARLFPFRQLKQEHADFLLDGVLRNRKRPWALWQWWRRLLLETIPDQLRDLNTVLGKWSPDVIVADASLWSIPLLLRETTGLPVAILSHIGLCLEPGDAGPVPGRAMPPRRTRFQRLAASAVESLSGAAAWDVKRTASRVRAAHGLPPLTRRVTEILGEMDLYLVPACPSFDYARRDLPPSVRYIGPCLWPAGQTEAWPRSHLRDVRPRVVVGEGTLYAQDSPLLSAAIAGLARSRPMVTVYPGKGRDLTAPEFADLPPNVTVRPWQPPVIALQDADVAVTNGNTDCTMAALCRGIPLLVVPSFLDQAEVAMRVSECRAGIAVTEGECTARAIRAAVERLCSEPTYWEAATRLAAELDELGGPVAAVHHLEGLLTSRYAAANERSAARAARPPCVSRV